MNGSPRLEGILATLVTPFSADALEIDEKALRALVSRLVAAKVGGLIPCGSTGEFQTLTVEERKRVSEVVVEAARGPRPGRAPHRGTHYQGDDRPQRACGGHWRTAAVMVVPPFYESPGWAELLDHYAAVAGAVSIPLVVYNIPSASGVRMSAEQISELAAIPGVGFIKDSSGDALLLTQLLQEFGDRLQVFNGLDSLTFYAFAAGRAVRSGVRRTSCRNWLWSCTESCPWRRTSTPDGRCGQGSGPSARFSTARTTPVR